MRTSLPDEKIAVCNNNNSDEKFSRVYYFKWLSYKRSNLDSTEPKSVVLAVTTSLNFFKGHFIPHYFFVN